MFHSAFFHSIIDKHQRSPTHSTTRVTTYTCYMYCCHNTGIYRRDFKFSVFL